MAKHLTKKQKAEICSKYAAGSSYRNLAAEYGVSSSSIMRVIRGSPDYVAKCDALQKEAEEAAQKTMREWFENNSTNAQNIMNAVMRSFTEEDFSQVSVRDRAGLMKIIHDVFAEPSVERDDGKAALERLCKDLENIK